MTLLVIAFLLSLLVAVVRNPANALATTLMVFGFEQFAQVHVPFFRANSSFINVLFAAFVVVALVQRMRRGEQIASNFSHGTVVLATLYVVHPISALWAPNPDVTLQTFIAAAPYIIVLTFLPSLTVRGVDDLRAALHTLLFFGTILLILIVTTSDFASRGLILERIGRSKMSVANPLALSQLAGVIAIVAIVVPPRNGRLPQVLAGAAAVLAMYVCVRTGSRGQFVAAVIAVAVAVSVQAASGTIRTLQAILIVGVGVGILIWLLSVATEQFGDRFSYSQMHAEYTGGRVAPSESMLRVWAKAGPWAWILGLGGSSSYHFVGFYPHVVPVEVLTELGVFGLLLYAGFAVLSISRARWLLGVVSADKRGTIICACALFGFEWILACKQGALLAADFMMCHGLIVCGVSQTWKLGIEADGIRWARRPFASQPLASA